MALAVSDAQDEIAYLIFGKAFASLSSDQQGQITSLGAIALDKIEGWADLFEMGGSSSNAPAKWVHWLTLETCALISNHRDQGRVSNFRRQADQALQSALETIGAGEITASASATTFTLEQVRKFVFTRAVRRQIYPTIAEVDTAIQNVLHEAYNAHLWRFRRLLVRIQVDNTNAVTITKRDGSNGWEALSATQKFDALATRHLYYAYNTQSVYKFYGIPDEDMVSFVTADQFSALTARDPDQTGKPRFFRIEGSSSGTYVWHFYPYPDATYTMYAEIFLEGPQTTLSDTSFAEFPPAFSPILRDAVLLRVLEDRGRSDNVLRERVLIGQEKLLADYEDVHGMADNNLGVRDFYNDVPDNAIGGAL